jgi:regulator of protease activity HflC (stomatin/prohibitin superfamily)
MNVRLGPFACLLLSAGCGSVIEPGHRGLFFDPRHGGLQHEVLGPGWHRVGVWGRLDDFDVTYSTKKEELHTTSAEGLGIDIKVSIIFRPVVSELYDLDVEIGPNFYDEVIGPEFRTAARGVFARHSYLDMQKINEKLEDEIEAEVRRRTAGKHVEISSVTMEELSYGPDIAGAIRQKLVGEQEAVRKKVALENEALRRKLELEQEAERQKLQAEADVHKKENERRIATEQAAIDKVQAEGEAAVRITKAKAEAQALSVLAKAQAEQKRAEATAITPLMVMMHAYDSLAKLGGSGTSVMLGDWSHVPSFLFPQFPGLQLSSGGKHVATAP